LIVYLFCSFYTLLTFVYLLFLFRMNAGLRALHFGLKRPLPPENLPYLSVIVPVKDESECVEACVQSLRAQKYPHDRMQVIIVDDHSDDDTMSRALESIETDGRIVLLDLRASGLEASGKKAAISAGIDAATGELIVTTDADCTHSEDWLMTIAHCRANGAEVIAGPVVLWPAKTLFERLQKMEFIGLMGIGMGFFGIGAPRMCNGANFAYSKDSFRQAGGFSEHAALASGDDEFLLQSMVYDQHRAFTFNASMAAIVRTTPAPSLRAFLRQRMRWASKGGRYKDRRFVSFLILLFTFLLWTACAPFTICVSSSAFLYSMFLVSSKIMAEYSVLRATSSMLGEQIRLTDFIIAEILHPYYLVTVSLAGTILPLRWKNRQIKT
jgi:cellulose synthase/poly-beta-1,6-N-acetylglucosamine synthase-like glycosyltransferase